MNSALVQGKQTDRIGGRGAILTKTVFNLIVLISHFRLLPSLVLGRRHFHYSRYSYIYVETRLFFILINLHFL